MTRMSTTATPRFYAAATAFGWAVKDSSTGPRRGPHPDVASFSCTLDHLTWTEAWNLACAEADARNAAETSTRTTTKGTTQ